MRRCRSVPRGPWAWLLSALVLTLAAAAPAQEPPYQAEVIEDADVYAGAGPQFYVVGRVPRGAEVTVRRVFAEWYEIVAPEGVFSYISKAYVDARGDGRTGVVNRDRAEVKAASTVSPGESYKLQVMLAKGDPVQIVGEEGSFYRIVPPQLGGQKDALVWLRPGTVRPIEPGQARERQPVVEQPAVEQPVVEQPAQPEQPAQEVEPRPVEPQVDPGTPQVERPTERQPEPQPQQEGMPPAEQPVERRPQEGRPQESPDLLGPDRTVTQEIGTATATRPAETATGLAERFAPPDTQPAGVADGEGPRNGGTSRASARANSPRVRELEQRLEQAQRLPLEQQPLRELIAGYEAVRSEEELSSIDRRIVAIRLAQLRRNLDIAAAVGNIRQAQEQVSTEPFRMPEPVEPPPPGTYDPSRYDAIGQLLASAVFDGTTGPRLFRLVDPTTGRTLGYVEPGAAFDPQQVLGKLVGVVADSRYDPALKLQVMSVRRMEVLRRADEGAREDEREREPEPAAPPPPAE